MPEKKQNDVIRFFCEGEDEQFRQISCKYYTHNPEKECNILKQYKISVFWDKCRENSFEILYHAVNKHLQRFKEQYEGVDDQENIDFKGMITRLKKQRLRYGFNLFVWHSYVSRACYRELKNLLIRRGQIPSRRKCGNCKYFPEVKPYICPITKKKRKKTAEPCEEYGWKFSMPMTQTYNDRIDHPEGSEKIPIFAERMGFTNDQQPFSTFADDRVSDMMGILKERVKAEPRRKKRERYERQYDIFVNFLDMLSKDISKKEAIRSFARKWRISEKTIQRDIREFRKFLKEKMS